MTAEQRTEGLLDPVVQAAREELGAAGLPGDRILVLRAIWRDLIIGCASQLERAGAGIPPAHRPVRGRRHGHAHRRGPGGVARSLAVGRQPGRQRPRTAGSAAPNRGGGRQASAAADPDPAGRRAPGGLRPCPSRPVPRGRPTPADGRPGDARHGGRLARDPRHDPLRPAHQGRRLSPLESIRRTHWAPAVADQGARRRCWRCRSARRCRW